MRALTEKEERDLIDSSFSFDCLQTAEVNVALYFLFLVPLDKDDLAFFSDDLHKLLIESKVNVITDVFFLRNNYVHFLLSLFLLEDDIEASDAIQCLFVISVLTAVSLENLQGKLLNEAEFHFRLVNLQLGWRKIAERKVRLRESKFDNRSELMLIRIQLRKQAEFHKNKESVSSFSVDVINELLPAFRASPLEKV